MSMLDSAWSQHLLSLHLPCLALLLFIFFPIPLSIPYSGCSLTCVVLGYHLISSYHSLYGLLPYGHYQVKKTCFLSVITLRLKRSKKTHTSAVEGYRNSNQLRWAHAVLCSEQRQWIAATVVLFINSK